MAQPVCRHSCLRKLIQARSQLLWPDDGEGDDAVGERSGEQVLERGPTALGRQCSPGRRQIARVQRPHDPVPVVRGGPGTWQVALVDDLDLGACQNALHCGQQADHPTANDDDPSHYATFATSDSTLAASSGSANGVTFGTLNVSMQRVFSTP